MWIKRQRGVTLVELIIAMVIIAAAVAGVLGAFSLTSRASADPVIAKQMAAIAEGMVAEVLVKPYGVQAGKGATRDTFNDVRDYDGYAANGIVDVNGAAIAGLENYQVSVNILGDQVGDNITLPNVPAGDVLKVTVTVTFSGESFALTGWRTAP
jgi:MSHA pilin protein MshD